MPDTERIIPATNDVRIRGRRSVHTIRCWAVVKFADWSTDGPDSRISSITVKGIPAGPKVSARPVTATSEITKTIPMIGKSVGRITAYLESRSISLARIDTA